MRNIMSLMFLVWGINGWTATIEQPDRNESQYNNQFSIVLDGYDPVSYFPEGGGTPIKGSEQISYMYGMRIYHFVSEANRTQFMTNPLKYEPTYGSYCAYAMANGGKIRINPLLFTVSGNRLHFFVNHSAKASFDADVTDHENRADANWFGFSGEKPRK